MGVEIALLVTVAIMAATIAALFVVLARIAHRLLTQNIELQRTLAVRSTDAVHAVVQNQQGLDARQHQPQPEHEGLAQYAAT